MRKARRAKKRPKIDALIARKRCEQLAANQVTTEDEEKIDTDPAKTMHPSGKRKTQDAGVVNNNDEDSERAEKIEAGLAFAILKAGIDCSFAHEIMDARTIAARRGRASEIGCLEKKSIDE